MAEVWAARLRGEAGFHRLVAIKRIQPHLAADLELVDRFLDEARIAAHVTSPHVVQTLDLGRSPDGTPYIVLDLVVGVTLMHFMRGAAARETTPLGAAARRTPSESGPRASTELPVPALVELLAQVAEGLADIHDARGPEGKPLEIVHRDVSPQNVLIGVDGRARLGDFGIARAVSSRVRTHTEQVLGKFGYMSPEQARGKRVDARSDVFSLGIVVWEALARRRLFATARDDAEQARLLDEPVAPLSMVAGVPEELSAVVASALERDPDARCPSAREVARRLRRAAARIGPVPDARELARLVALAGGDALDDLQRRIAEAAATDPQTEPRPIHDIQLLATDDTTDRDPPTVPEPAPEPPTAPTDGRSDLVRMSTSPWLPALLAVGVAAFTLVALLRGC
jgi:serine/threonine-protein kinase